MNKLLINQNKMQSDSKSEIMARFKKNVLLKNYTTFRIGGLAEYFFISNTKEDLIKAIKAAKKLRLPFFILGGGSNVLFSDKGYNGVVIKVKNQELKIKSANCKSKIIESGAGKLLNEIVSVSSEEGLTGLEWAVGIPGTIGGAVCGNAGAFGKSMADIVEEVEVFDAKEEKIKFFKKKDCRFSYRESIFKKKNNLVILSVKLRFKTGVKKEIKKRMRDYLNFRRKNQPLNFSSAGSVFKNPQGFSAGELIEKCGLKGKRKGKAEISKKHANFIVNLGGAKSSDVMELIRIIKQRVKDKFSVILEEEVRIVS